MTGVGAGVGVAAGVGVGVAAPPGMVKATVKNTEPCALVSVWRAVIPFIVALGNALNE